MCTLTGNRSVWLSSLASQYPPEFCREFAQVVSASAPRGARANAQDPAQRWTAVLARTTQQVGPAPRPPRCPDTLSIRWEFAIDAWGVRMPRDRRARLRVDRSGSDCDLVTSQLNMIDSPSKEHEAEAATGDKTIYHQPASDDAHQCRDELRRTRHTPVIHCGPRRLRCVGLDPPLPIGRGPWVAGQSPGTPHGQGIVRKRRERSRRVDDAVRNNLL